MGWRARDRAYHRFVGHQGDGGAMVPKVERAALEQRVPGLLVVDFDLDPSPPGRGDGIPGGRAAAGAGERS